MTVGTSIQEPGVQIQEPGVPIQEPGAPIEEQVAPIGEPTGLQTFWASISALIAKESRWRMRGRRAFVVMTIYVAILALIVLGVYRMMYERAAFDNMVDGNIAPVEVVSGSLSLLIGQAVFTTILIVQALLTLLLAPALTSGAVSMEREKQTLELLITTPVSTLGMVVGKLIASLGYVFLLVLASVPLMSIVFVFGGIAPDDVIRAYVLLFAMTFAAGSIGLFMSAVTKRTQIATALSYVIGFLIAFGTVGLHAYMYASSQPNDFGPRSDQRHAPEAILWLSPVVAGVDLLCTAIPDRFAFACSYTATVTGQDQDFENPAVNPPRDAFWPRSVLAFVGLGVGLTLLTTQYIAPSRRIRRQRKLPAPPVEPPAEAVSAS